MLTLLNNERRVVIFGALEPNYTSEPVILDKYTLPGPSTS